MKIKFRIAADQETEINVSSLEVDGIPYVPPAPAKPQRWEVEVALCGDDNGTRWASSYPDRQDRERARVCLWFDSDGRVGIVPGERAKLLAGWLRDEAETIEPLSRPSDRDRMRELADLIDGGQSDCWQVTNDR